MRAEAVRVFLLLVASFFGRFFLLDSVVDGRDMYGLDGGLDVGLLIFRVFVLDNWGCLFDSEGGHLSFGVEDQGSKGEAGVRSGFVRLLDLEVDFFGLRFLLLGRIHVV